MATPLTCADNNRSVVEIEKASYVVLEDGTYAQLQIEVSPGDALDCTTAQVGIQTLRKGSFVWVNDTQTAKQVIPVT